MSIFNYILLLIVTLKSYFVTLNLYLTTYQPNRSGQQVKPTDDDTFKAVLNNRGGDIRYDIATDYLLHKAFNLTDISMMLEPAN